MFTGIVEETGAVRAFEKGAAGARLEIDARTVLSDLELGGSIAVNGCCLTAVEITPRGFAADLSPETLDKTNLGDLAVGARVNLERPLLPSSRLSGHFVQGHVDATGELEGLREAGDGNWILRVRAPRALLRYLVYKGSVTLDGISLTIARLDDDVIEVAIIPHTFQETNLGARKPGDRINVEVDILAKYVDRQREFSAQ
ncbi:MAG: riboflavin synthase [Acidobacteria bacterium]|nr:riboflavin synthase [Acidobacteriota bacterium]